MLSTTLSPLVIQIGRRSGKSIRLLIPRWSRHGNCTSVSFNDPNCPPYVRKAKQILRKIIIATDGSTGGSSVAAESIASNEDGGG
jgi:hypothetical protein